MRENTNIRPRIALTVTPNGVESVSILPGGGSDGRGAGYGLCSFLEEEINCFDDSIKQKFGYEYATNKERLEQ
jgi:hypothetical protein